MALLARLCCCTPAELRGIVGRRVRAVNLPLSGIGTEWHLAFRRPTTSFKLSNPREQIKCFHHSNLIPRPGRLPKHTPRFDLALFPYRWVSERVGYVRW